MPLMFLSEQYNVEFNILEAAVQQKKVTEREEREKRLQGENLCVRTGLESKRIL